MQFSKFFASELLRNRFMIRVGIVPRKCLLYRAIFFPSDKIKYFRIVQHIRILSSILSLSVESYIIQFKDEKLIVSRRFFYFFRSVVNSESSRMGKNCLFLSNSNIQTSSWYSSFWFRTKWKKNGTANSTKIFWLVKCGYFGRSQLFVASSIWARLLLSIKAIEMRVNELEYP